MGFSSDNALVLVLLFCCLNVFEAYRGSPVAEAPIPVLPPSYHHGRYPVVAPSQPPSHPPYHHHHHHSHSPNQSPSHHHHHHPHAPSPSPVYPAPHYVPSHAPAHPPAHYSPVPSPVYPPTQPPRSYIPRSFIEVQGVVYCKSCKYPGVDTLLGAKPLDGATINLSCKNTKYAPAIRTATTDKNGYFRVAAPKNVTSYAFHRCKVYLVKSPEYSCSKPSNLHGGMNGADLKPAKAFIDAENNPVVLYNVGPLAFEPTCAR